MTPARFPDDESLDRHLSRLSQIPTRWGDLRDVRDGGDAAAAAAARLLGRYQRAVYRYLLAALRDEHAADDLFQEFALRLVRGSFNTADPARGRFRDFLKTTLRNLITNHRQRQGKPAVPLGSPGVEPATAESPDAEADAAFLERWREELLARAWEALRRADEGLCAVLRFRTDNPELRSPRMAERLAPLLGRPVSADWVRKRLQLAREKYTDLLVEEVAGSLADPTEDALADEVAELGLLDYCKAALQRRRA
jgi:RNA polymerase sigma-70 factor (ECF subfamily)